MYRVSSMIRRVIALGTLVVVLLCGATPASAFVVIDADIYGWITDTETGEGIDGATVWLYYFDSQWGWLYPFDTTTVSSGYYSFKGLSSGTEYYMQVTHPRYRRNARATGWTGPTVRADLALRPLVQRIWGNNRYSTAEAITRKVWSGGGTQWPTVTDVVIASGEDRASADPLAAAGLCWLYDAPLFLVSSTQVPGEVKEAIRQIAVARHPGRIALHVVGGTTSIPAARIREITDYATAGTTDPDIDRVLSS
ncbi:MAG: cell wall-binding repeat-containing protein, partial [Coriobacteriia bacterium]|nr:cell wall-binding repeat-containing protein [Coriobacteriia bacterium]